MSVEPLLLHSPEVTWHVLRCVARCCFKAATWFQHKTGYSHKGVEWLNLEQALQEAPLSLVRQLEGDHIRRAFKKFDISMDDDIEDFIKTVLKRARQMYYNQAVLVLGAAGSGKSSVVNFLRGSNDATTGVLEDGVTIGAHVYDLQSEGNKLLLVDTEGWTPEWQTSCCSRLCPRICASKFDEIENAYRSALATNGFHADQTPSIVIFVMNGTGGMRLQKFESGKMQQTFQRFDSGRVQTSVIPLVTHADCLPRRHEFNSVRQSGGETAKRAFKKRRSCRFRDQSTTKVLPTFMVNAHPDASWCALGYSSQVSTPEAFINAEYGDLGPEESTPMSDGLDMSRLVLGGRQDVCVDEGKLDPDNIGYVSQPESIVNLVGAQATHKETAEIPEDSSSSHLESSPANGPSRRSTPSVSSLISTMGSERKTSDDFSRESSHHVDKSDMKRKKPEARDNIDDVHDVLREINQEVDVQRALPAFQREVRVAIAKDLAHQCKIYCQRQQFGCNPWKLFKAAHQAVADGESKTLPDELTAHMGGSPPWQVLEQIPKQRGRGIGAATSAFCGPLKFLALVLFVGFELFSPWLIGPWRQPSLAKWGYDHVKNDFMKQTQVLVDQRFENKFSALKRQIQNISNESLRQQERLGKFNASFNASIEQQQERLGKFNASFNASIEQQQERLGKFNASFNASIEQIKQQQQQLQRLNKSLVKEYESLKSQVEQNMSFFNKTAAKHRYRLSNLEQPLYQKLQTPENFSCDAKTGKYTISSRSSGVPQDAASILVDIVIRFSGGIRVADYYVEIWTYNHPPDTNVQRIAEEFRHGWDISSQNFEFAINGKFGRRLYFKTGGQEPSSGAKHYSCDIFIVGYK